MQETGYEVIGEAGSGIDAIKVCGSSRPDLLILDLALPCISGAEVLRRVRKELPLTRVLIYTGTRSSVLIKEALRERPHGYADKHEGLKLLKKAISMVANGGSFFGEPASHLMYETTGTTPEQSDLSPREREILQMVAEGRSSKQISGLLDVALKTVENHRANLMAKLGMHDVASLTLYAARRGMVPIE